MQAQATRTTLSIDVETYRSLVALARRNERTTSAEARVALRGHLEREGVTSSETRRLPEPAMGGSTPVDHESLEGRGRSSARFAGRAHELEPGDDEAAS